MVWEIVSETLMITVFVLSMMLLIEYINIRTAGRLSQRIKKSNRFQLLFSSMLGVIPGCLGSYLAVTLFSHRIFSFGALTSTMIATSGDEAFLMLKLFPREYLLLTGILFVSGIIAGFLTNKLLPGIQLNPEHELPVHKHHIECVCLSPKEIRAELKNISFERGLLISGFLLMLALLLSNQLTHSHTGHNTLAINAHIHEDHLFSWSSITYFIVILTSLYIIITASKHFL